MTLGPLRFPRGSEEVHIVRPEQWRALQRAAKCEVAGEIPVALIVDSPWIPGHLGLNQLDYYLDPRIWFESNLRVYEQFPGITFVPSWWVEYGMAIEPSALGCKVCFWEDRPPDIVPVLKDIRDAAGLSVPNPASDGFMPLALRLYATQKQRIFDAGHTIPFATARGPLCLASFLRGLTGLMLDLSEHQAAVHAMLDVLTTTVIRWLEAQCETIGDCVGGVFVLDDVPGMLSRQLYQEFAHPYLKRVFDAFPKEWVKMYHNDANIKPFASDLAGLGIDVLNWSHRFAIPDVLRATGGKLCLMGNVAPLELGVCGSPESVKAAALTALSQAAGRPFVLSLGGGTSPGMPGANVQALADAATEWNGARRSAPTA
jgi:uroporphyrinogen decarboxylase